MLPMNAVMEKFTDNLMIPVGALCFCIFVGWSWKTRQAVQEIENDGTKPFALRGIWSVIIKYIAPVVILVILFFTIGKGEGLS